MTVGRTHPGLVALLVAGGVLVTATAGCTNPLDNSVNTLPQVESDDSGDDPGDETATGDDTAQASDAGDTGDGTPCGCLTVGDWYQFDLLEVHSLGGNFEHAVIPTLNPLWAADMGKNELNILMEVVSVADDEVELTVMNGARIDGEESICLLPDTASTMLHPRDGCNLEASLETDIHVYAGSESNPKNCTNTLAVKHAIPVERAIIESVVASDCSRIDDGNIISGIIGELELNSVCTCLVLGTGLSTTCEDLDPSFDDGSCPGCNDNYINLGILLPGFEPVAFDCATHAEQPAVCLTGAFSAVRLDATPPVCGE